MAPFDLVVPERGRVPLVVEVPHSSVVVPPSLRDEVTAGPTALRRDADLHVDALCADAPSEGAALLVARVSRYVVDLNRAPDDVDAETVPDHPRPRPLQPRGVVWRLTTDGADALRRPLRYAELEARLARYHAPYHAALEAELDRTRARFGHAILLAAHSMPSVGRAGHADSGTRRADVVPGTRGGTTAHPEIIRLVDAHFRAAGLSVRHDDPYRGGFTTGHYGRPAEGWHAVQVELNRALFCSEATGEPRAGAFERVQALMRELVRKLGAFRLDEAARR